MLVKKQPKPGEDASKRKFTHDWRVTNSLYRDGSRRGKDINYSAYASKISGFLDPDATIEQRKMDEITMRSKFVPGLKTIKQIRHTPDEAMLKRTCSEMMTLVEKTAVV